MSKFVLSQIYNNFSEYRILSSPTYGFFYPIGKKINERYLTNEVFGVMFCISTIIFFIVLFGIYKNKYILVVSVTAIVFFISYINFNDIYNSVNSKRVYDANIKFYEIIKEVEKYGELPKEIYLIDEDKNDLRLQFFLSNYSLQVNYEEVDTSKIIITKYEENIPEGCKVIKTSAGGYICLKNDKLIHLFEMAGF